MKKLLKISLAIFTSLLFVFGIYLYKLRSLAIEGNRVYEHRCTDVNPSLISYKNSFLKFADYLKYPEKYKGEDSSTFLTDYIFGIKEYVDAENRWLEMQDKFRNRLDFKLIEPWYLKQAWFYQMKMSEGYRDDAQTMLDIWNNKVHSEELIARQAEARKRRNEAIQEYSDFFDKASDVSDWRKIFCYVPDPKGCSEENMTIPDTGGSIDWVGTPTPQPKVIPGLESIGG